MDPYSSDSELINIHTLFHQYQYQSVLDFDTTPLSTANQLPARILQLRSRVALGQAKDVLSELKSAKEPELKAVAALAKSSLHKREEAVADVQRLIADDASAENAVVQVVGGTVLHAGGQSEEALSLLGRHQGNLDAVALIVQIHLQQNRNDLAVKEISAARRWAQDNVLVNMAESWVAVRTGGEKYQQAFYVFEELAQAPSTATVQTLVQQAVAELHLGRTEEAQAALEQAMAKDAGYADAIANALVLQVIIGKDGKELRRQLESTAPAHSFLTDLAEKSQLFDTAAARFSPRVATTA